MNTKLIINCIAASALLVGGCSTQTNKPPPGTGLYGPVSNGQGGVGGQQYSNGNNGNSTGGFGRGNSTGGGGNNQTGAGSNGYGQNGNSGGGLGSNGSGQRNSGNAYGRGNGNGQGGFGSGSAYGGNTKSSYTPADLRDPRSILAQRIVYFDYDKSTLSQKYIEILDAHGSLLTDFPELNVRLEGHADERGSREYNVALSERRAYAVLNYLKIKGVKSSQADIVGYGEEVPATFGHSEGSWNKNRRVEIIYAGE